MSINVFSDDPIDDDNNDNIIHKDDISVKSNMDILNIFTIYYKRLYKKNNNEHMFEGIDYDKVDSTNTCMELFYEHLEKYRLYIEDHNECVLYEMEDTDIPIDTFDECYILSINDKSYLAPLLISLISHLSTMNWESLDWHLYKIKGAS